MLTIVITIITLAVIWGYILLDTDKLRKYRDALGLEKANLVYGADYQKIKDLILPTRKSTFERQEPVIWLYRKDGSQLFLAANRKNDVRIWLQTQTNLKGVHIVLDGTQNNSVLSNLKTDKLPPQQIKLEGTFSEHFKLYCEENQQVIALQIIAPDVMAYLLDNLLSTDIEIVDNQIAVISRGSAKTEEKLKATIGLARQIDKLTRATSKVTSA